MTYEMLAVSLVLRICESSSPMIWHLPFIFFPIISGNLIGMAFLSAAARNGQGHIPEKDACFAKHAIPGER